MDFIYLHLILKEFSNIPLEHTPDLQPSVYEGIPFVWGFGDALGMLQGYVGVLLEILHCQSPTAHLMRVSKLLYE